MSANNDDPPPAQEGDPSLPAAAAARAALALAGDAAGAGGASANHRGGASGSPTALRSPPSNIVANRSSSPPAAHPPPPKSPPPLALRGGRGEVKIAEVGDNFVFLGGGAYPLKANCDFVPGGIEVRPASIIGKEETGQIGKKEDRAVYLGKYCTTGATSGNSGVGAGAGGATSPRGAPMNTRSGARGIGLTVNTTGSDDKEGPEVIVRRALMADATLRKFAVQFANTANGNALPGQRLPSLSHLANSALVNPLTSVPANGAVEWAESMIMEYMDGRYEEITSIKRSGTLTEQGGYEEFESVCQDPATGQSLPNLEEASVKASELLKKAMLAAWVQEEAATGRTPTNISKVSDTPLSMALTMPPPSLSGLLKALWKGQRGEDLLGNTSAGKSGCAYEGGPCGYVFRRGDIAWNCRTCQTDATCVLCEACFRESDHEGHEVFFHRTTPGGCCDCGDVEAWDLRGMCGRHRPPEAAKEGEAGDEANEEGMAGAGDGTEDDFEAVRAAGRARSEHERHVNGVPATIAGNGEPQPLPPRLAAALAVVIGSAVQAVLAAAEGAAVGADVSQWRLRWADEICRIWNGCGEDEEYYRRAAVLRALVAKGKGTPEEAKELAREELWAHPKHVLDSHDDHYSTELPSNYRLCLRLHNDDVHTFDDVIKALHHRSSEPNAVPVGGEGSVGKVGGAGLTGNELKKLSENVEGAGLVGTMNEVTTTTTTTTEMLKSRSRSPSRNDMDISPPRRNRPRSSGASSPTWNRSPVRSNADDVPHPVRLPGVQFASEVDPSAPLVPRVEAATELTKKVDMHGQVLVHPYETLNGAGVGFARLRGSAGLHCSVSTTAQMEAEERAAALLEWLSGLIGSHPVVGAMVVQALVDVTEGEDVLCCEERDGAAGVAGMSKGVAVWSTPQTMPCWSGTNLAWWTDDGADGGYVPAWRRRLEAFPPHLESSYLTKEEGRKLFQLGMESKGADQFIVVTGADPDFYAAVPYSLPDSRLRKSPHALWGTLTASHLSSERSVASEGFTHPLLTTLTGGNAATGSSSVYLQQPLFVMDTDLRKHEEGESLTSSLYPHQMAGLNMLSGASHIDEHGSEGSDFFGQQSAGVASVDYAGKIVSCSSFVAPASPILLMLLLDPYSPKQVRSGLHRLFLSLLTDSRFKSRFAACLGAVAYRPTSALFCAGIGTEADTLLGFTVQLFTTGSLVKSLGNLDATRTLLCREDGKGADAEVACVSALPIAHSVVRCIHANILGATRDVSSVVKNSESAVPPALMYQPGSEHPLSTRLPGAPDDKFIDSRCMKHKRLPHLLRDLEYIFETPGTAVKLLRTGRGSTSGANTPSASPTNTSHLGGTVTVGAMGAVVDAMNDSLTPAPSFTSPVVSNNLVTYSMPNALDFPTVWSRLLRLGQGIDLQKRKISGGHVEFEDERWLGAYGLSLNLSSTGDALSESPFSGGNVPMIDTQSGLSVNREAMGGLFAAYFREIKMWLYREGLLETGLSRPTRESGELEALQRSTLHIARAQLDESSVTQVVAATGVAVANSCDVACEKGVKNLPEAKLVLLEAALLHERTKLTQSTQLYGTSSSHGPVMGDWLKVPHSPLAGDSFSFHLPLHRSLARSILCFCAAIVPEDERRDNPNGWWRLPLLDDDDDFASGQEEAGIVFKQDSLSALVRPTHRSSNFRVVWSSGPECSPPEASLRRSRSRMLSALLASSKVIHSLCDHPLRCIAASQQIDHHMWARNGGSTAGMALNYGSVPLCRSLRDLDVALVQLSASGFNVGLGARRVFALLTNRFSMDGYLCDPDRRSNFGRIGWARPPRMQEPEHAEMLAESFFTTLCVLVSDLPAPPPTAPGDDSTLRRNLKRELLHALAVEPRSHSEAMTAASAAVSRRDESDGGAVGSGGGASSFRAVFTEVLQAIGRPRNQGSRATGPPMFQLKPEESHEYDPSFYHLRKTEHQHAMDNVARLRRQKLVAESKSQGVTASAMVLPLVAIPPVAHPRFMASRLLLHLPSTYAAIRRYLMYVLFNGSWLPPSKPEPENSPLVISVGGDGDVAAVPGSREAFKRSVSAVSNRSTVSTTSNNNAFSAPPSFSPETVAASSKSFLEVLHILTLQAHTLEECSTLHRALPFLDHEQKALSSSIEVNSYLAQLVAVPESLLDVWALRPAPDGPLPSAGSGENRGSVLGLLAALYEHRDNAKSSGTNQKSASDDHGGARVLSADGLKWLLRLVGALADGAGSMEVAYKSALTGIPVDSSSLQGMSLVQLDVCDQVKRMLANLPDLWPGNDADSASDANSTSAASEKSREAQRAAKARALAKMKKMQSSFAATIHSQFKDDSEKKLVEDVSEENLCIICKCDDADGDNGPMGYLGHVQRSRVAQLASKAMLRDAAGCGDSGGLMLDNIYRVVGDKGCQLRSTESMESAPVAFLPRGSIVEAIQTKLSSPLGLLSRRILVRRVIPEGHQKEGAQQQIVQGWASIQSSQGYVILSPLSSLCYTNTRWGPTRPVVRQCGHAAHLKCVEAHCLSLHQRAAGNQPFDGRFSANIDDGEFLCPLCKQLSNIVIPEDGPSGAASVAAPLSEENEGFEVLKNDSASSPADISLIRNILARKSPATYSDASCKATEQFGASLSQAMQLSEDGGRSTKMRREREFWHPALRRWDFEDDDQGSSPQIGSVLRLMRQQLIAWAAVGHSAAATEASGRGARTEMFGEVTYSSTDPWSDYASKVKDSHPMLLDLRRMLTATASLFDAVTFEAGKQLGTNDEKAKGETVPIFGRLISDILEGQYWTVSSPASAPSNDDWRVVTSIVASMMCHVSKEDTVAPRLEARAVAAAMWTITGSTPPPASVSSGGSMNLDSSPEVEVNDAGNVNVANQDMAGVSSNPAEDDNAPSQPRPVLPPKPLCIYRVERNLALELDPKWGTLDPFKVESMGVFRPAVASAFMYVPLLAWDLNILAGAVFSSLLSNAKSNSRVSCSELLQAAKVLLVGRLVQVLSTGGFLTTSSVDEDDDYDDFDEDQSWDDAKRQKEATAVKELLSVCRQTLTGATSQGAQGIGDASLLKNVGNALLPFGRTLILLLRASSSATRQRQRRSAKTECPEPTLADKAVAKMTEDANAMTMNDGFRLLEVIGAPLPSSILKVDESHSSWISLATRWLTSLRGFEAYHGTSGKGLMFNAETKAWAPVSHGNAPSDQRAQSLQNLHVETSAAAVEVEVAHLPPQGEDANPEDGDSDVDFEASGSEDLSSGESNEDEVMEIVDEALAAQSDDELENVDMDVDFDDADFDDPAMNDFGAAAPMMVQDEQDLDVDDASDANAALSEPDGSKIAGPNDRMFSYVSRSAIIPYQPSILGISQVGPGPRGARGELFEYSIANRVMKDLSHLGSIHVAGAPLSCLAKLPKSFVELYSMVNRVKGLDSRSDDDDSGVEETAICLLTGAVMPSGRRNKARNRPGTCTVHARKVGSGIGIFFLVQKCTILLMHNNKSAYSPSLYVDEHGEEDVGLRRGRPLFFSEERYQALETLWRTHGIPREVSQIRSTSDRVIRDNWY